MREFLRRSYEDVASVSDFVHLAGFSKTEKALCKNVGIHGGRKDVVQGQVQDGAGDCFKKFFIGFNWV